MTHGSLFSGIGGFDLASEWMGWENLFHCEWNPFGQKVLNYYWPNAELFTDITKSNFTKYANKIDILTGGFPCQPYSASGKRLGKEDDRHLWPEMLRAIREIQPCYVVGENVRGLTNWNGGVVFNEVQTDLETEGYEVLPVLLPACSVNAPHRRDRIWFIAYSKQYADRLQRKRRMEMDGIILDRCKREKETNKFIINDTNENIAVSNDTDTDCKLSEIRNRERKTTERAIKKDRIKSFYSTTNWKNFPTVSPICNGNDGLSDRLDGITFPKWRNESIKAGGNAIVPQVAYQIFKTINELEKLNNEF